MGFFDEITKSTIGKKRTRAERGHRVHIKTYYNNGGCATCPLDKYDSMLRHPKMDPTGGNAPLIYVLAEAPGGKEDQEGTQLIGPAGECFWKHAKQAWPPDLIEGRYKYVRTNNVLNCRPPGNATPEMAEIESCRSRIVADIQRTKPPFVLCLGGAASEWITDDTAGISVWRGRWVPAKIGDHVCWSFHTFHPSYVMRSSSRYGESEEERIFGLDLGKFADAIINQTLPKPLMITDGYSHNIVPIRGEDSDDLERVERHLTTLAKEKRVGVDIETNGLRPTKFEGAKIISIAIGTYEHTVSIALDHPQAGWTEKDLRLVKSMVREFLLNSVVKIAHNAPFEQEWLVYEFGNEMVSGVTWQDTMAQACAIDQRLGLLSLDSLTRLHFGFHLKSLTNIDRKNSEKVPLKDLLPYGGMDTKYTALLYDVQSEVIDRNPSLRWTVDNLVDTGGTVVLSQLKGIPVDWDIAKDLRQKFGEKVEVVVQEFQRQPSVIQAARRFGGFNHASEIHLTHLFRDILKRPEGRTKGSKYTTKAEVLEQMKTEPCAVILLKIREYEKLLSTYIDSLEDTVHLDRRLHPNFNTMLTRTGRLSSSDPNIQNFPARKNSEVRQVVIPPGGHLLLSGDYAQIEARAIAMASEDETFIEALWTGFDIHMHYAKRINEEYPEWVQEGHFSDPAIAKQKRQEVKNQWVFALFYGSSYKAVGKAMGLPETVSKPLVDEFWHQFQGVKKWQERSQELYQKRGYCETMHGRRRQGPIGWTRIINTPIQGVASDIVTAAGNRLRKEHGIVLAFNVHDDLTFFVPEDKKDEMVKIIAKEMTRPVEPWMIVPIVVEMKIGNAWGRQKAIGDFSSADLHGHVRR